MNEKKIEKIENILKVSKYHKDLDKQLTYQDKYLDRDDRMSPEEIKMNKQLLKESREYFNLQKKI